MKAYEKLIYKYFGEILSLTGLFGSKEKKTDKKEGEIVLPEDAKIEIGIPVNTGKIIEIDILANGNVFAKGVIQAGMTGTFSFATLKTAKNKKGIVFKFSPNISIFTANYDIGSS